MSSDFNDTGTVLEFTPPRKLKTIKVETEQDFGYFSLIPQISYNHHFFEIELRWLFWMIAFRNQKLFFKKHVQTL